MRTMAFTRNTSFSGWRALVAGWVVLTGLITALVGGPASAAPGDSSSGAGSGEGSAVSIRAYDSIAVEREAKVIAGTTTNLVLRYVAGSALRDAAITLDLPRTDWPDPLRWHGYGLSHFDAREGLVAVRPHAGYPGGPGECRDDSITWSVSPLPEVQRITVEQVTCEPGEQIAVRLFKITAPRDPGVYRIPFGVSHAAGGEGRDLRLRVYPQPRTRLSVSLPESVPFETPVTLVVKALRPDGRIDRSYRGGVGLLSEDGKGCTFDARYARPVFDFTAADAGVREITVHLELAGYRIVARDVGGDARPGSSNVFEVHGMPDDHVPVCPISFH